MSLFPDQKRVRGTDPAVQVCGFYQVSKLKKLIDKPESPLEYLPRFKDDMTMVMQKHSDDATEFAWEAFRNFHKEPLLPMLIYSKNQSRLSLG